MHGFTCRLNREALFKDLRYEPHPGQLEVCLLYTSDAADE